MTFPSESRGFECMSDSLIIAIGLVGGLIINLLLALRVDPTR